MEKPLLSKNVKFISVLWRVVGLADSKFLRLVNPFAFTEYSWSYVPKKTSYQGTNVRKTPQFSSQTQQTHVGSSSHLSKEQSQF